MNTILLADDSGLSSSMLKSIFKAHADDYRIITAQNGKIAYEKAQKENPDLILMDWDMPEMDGIESLKHLKQNEHTRNIPVIMLIESERISEAFENGAVDYIKKPFDELELRARVQSAIALVNSMHELRRKSEEIEIQHDKIKIQRDNLVQQKKEITDSIYYAKRIQKAVLPPDDLLSSIFSECFVLYKPKHIISGDFYWVSQRQNKIIFAVGDATGHGVPGGFMSMLGIASLNEIINIFFENHHVYSLKANEILNKLREKIIKSLHQTGRNDESKDGMDLALCIIDTEKMTLQFSGANNPAIVISNDEVKRIKGDHMPIGIYDISTSFANHEMEVKNGDIVYLFSDGYLDQFGGDKGKKYMISRMYKLIKEIHHLPMHEQKQILDHTHDTWRGDLEQVDDILVMGVKIEKSQMVLKSLYNWNNKVILIVEDIEVNYLLIQEILSNYGAEIIRAENGTEAIELCKQKSNIDLILMDINLPGIDGFETTALIKQVRPDIPIIAVSAYNMPEARQKAIEAGCIDFISKPFNTELFLQTINPFLT